MSPFLVLVRRRKGPAALLVKWSMPPGGASATWWAVPVGVTSHVGWMTSVMIRAASASPGCWRSLRRLWAPSSCSLRWPYCFIRTYVTTTRALRERKLRQGRCSVALCWVSIYRIKCPISQC